MAVNFPAAFALLLLARPGVEQSGRLIAYPVATEAHEPALPGQHYLGDGATLFLPPRVDQRAPLPLLLVLPGTGGNGRSFLKLFTAVAKKRNFAVLGLSPDASGNFHTVDRFFDDLDARRPSATARWPAPPFGRDVAQTDRALRQTFRMAPIDPKRIGLLGFSHGGSFALSLGLANPQLFTTIAALSPGLLLLPLAAAGGGQSIFLAHGWADQTQPYRRTACSMTVKLGALGHRVRFMARPGGHEIDRDELAEALVHFLNRGSQGPKQSPPADC